MRCGPTSGGPGARPKGTTFGSGLSVLSYNCRFDQKIERLAEPGGRLVAPDEIRQRALQMMSHGIEVGPHDPPSLRVSGEQAANQTARILAKTGRRVSDRRRLHQSLTSRRPTRRFPVTSGGLSDLRGNPALTMTVY